MKNLSPLIEYFKQSELVVAYQKLENKLQSDNHYQSQYTALLNKQKAFVQSQHLKTPDFEQRQQHYEEALQTLTMDPLIHQYLALQEQINEELQMVSGLIEVALASSIKKHY